MSDQNRRPAGWIQTTVGEIAKSIQYGHTASATDDLTGPRFLRITDIQDGQVDWNAVPSCDIATDDIEKYRLKSGDIVFARTGATTGKSYLIRNCPDAVFASYLIRLRMHDGIFPAYVQAFFQTSDYWRQIEGGKRGIGQPNVNASVLATIELPIAPLNEQHCIVAKIEELFSDLDAGVAALKRAKANLKRYRASVLKTAVEGKLTEQWRAKHPATEPASALLARILKDRRLKWEADQLAKFAAAKKEPPKNWKEKYVEPTPPDTADLPELPEGWCWATTGFLCDCIVPNRDKPKSFSGDIPWVTLPDLDGRIQLVASSDGIGLTEAEATLYKAKVIPAGSVIMSCIGRFGLSAVLGRDAIINQQLHAFLVPALLSARYIAYSIRTQERLMISLSTATTIAYLNQDKCNAIPIPLAPLAEQKQIVNEVEFRLSQIAAADRQIELNLLRAARLRQSILKRAFEGKLVPQDPKDEPASALLERLRTSRTHDEANGTAATSKRTRAKIKESSGEPRTRIRRRPSSQN